MNLQTILWGYDSEDADVGEDNITPTDVEINYNMFLSNLTAGTFDTAGGILLTHEVDNFTMQEAINWYPRLRLSFSVRCIPHVSQHMVLTLSVLNIFYFQPAHNPHWRCPEHYKSIPRNELHLTHV